MDFLFLFLFRIIIISVTNFPKHTKIRNMFTETKNVFLSKPENMLQYSQKNSNQNFILKIVTEWWKHKIDKQIVIMIIIVKELAITMW